MRYAYSINGTLPMLTDEQVARNELVELKKKQVGPNWFRTNEGRKASMLHEASRKDMPGGMTVIRFNCGNQIQRFELKRRR